MTNTINAIDDRRVSQLRRIEASLPQSYDYLSPGMIAERQFDQGVRRLMILDGGPTVALRDLIDEVRHGLTTVDALDRALDALEYSLGLPQTVADPERAGGAVK